MQVSDKDIEIERLKTTVMALISKCELVEDHKADVQSAQNRFADSENQRVGLQ